MKNLILLCFLVLTISCKAQEGNYLFPDVYVGTWANATGNDIITITTSTITWTTYDGDYIVSHVDLLKYFDSSTFNFETNLEVYKLSLKKISRAKIRFDAQDLEGLSLRNDIYWKQTRARDKRKK